ncbi:phosphotransferase enzyme family protein [Aspergillus violaceofuscus CBS 115571]|uniref:Phosphotransferase enzyme family protein n=1 Tax=Aspergillus violaceofuscus (strain CBS 115571) TaxID=1450538 RepID=A0A2V5HIQ3_ASPV1|nr:phosphotransferase enzyme family protein [Aspergillus violaceofuscus CBS 115571]
MDPGGSRAHAERRGVIARLNERYVNFDVAALKTAIGKHVGHGSVKELVKLSEGGFNRVLLATMEDDFKAIVKIPYRISVPETYATASEVATLTFLRSKGFPVPEVYGWSATREDEVGVEYIIKEHAAGIGAETRWFQTTKYQKKALVAGIVDMEKKLFDIPSASDGDSETYCIGPIADYMFWDGQRAELELDRGPWSDPGQYLRAIAIKEVLWTERFGKPLECDFRHNTVFPGVDSHQDYLILLNKSLAIAPYLIPQDPKDILNRPTLHHRDLTPSNVFVCPETFRPTCIIDWQHTTITPLLLAAAYPRLFENPDPEPPAGLTPPEYPGNYDQLDPEDKTQVDELIRRQSLFYLYRDPLILPRQHLVDLAGRQWSGDLMTLRGSLMRIRDIWSHVPGHDRSQECPISFSEEELAAQSENEPMWCNLNHLVSHWRDELEGISEEGWVSTEKYDHAVKRNDLLKAEFAEGGSLDELDKIKRAWPFQDHEESY